MRLTAAPYRGGRRFLVIRFTQSLARLPADDQTSNKRTGRAQRGQSRALEGILLLAEDGRTSGRNRSVYQEKGKDTDGHTPHIRVCPSRDPSILLIIRSPLGSFFCFVFCRDRPAKSTRSEGIPSVSEGMVRLQSGSFGAEVLGQVY
jgi:hypothetical protein